MKIKRSELVRVLDIVDPVRAQNSISPPLMQFWLRGDTILTSNDFVTVSVKFKTPFKCPLPGTVLSLLKASRASDIEIEPLKDDQGLELVLGPRSTSVIPILENAKFIDTFREPDGEVIQFGAKRGPTDEGGLIDAIKLCLRSVAPDSAHPDTLGVTLIGEGSQIELYSTDDKVLTAALVPCKKPGFGRAVLPAMFCQQLIKLAGKEKVEFLIDDRRATAIIGKNKDIILQCKLIVVDRPTAYSGIHSEHVTDEVRDSQVTLSKNQLLDLEEAVAQSMVIAGSGTEEVWSSVSVKGGNLTIETKHDRLGEMSNTFPIGKKHPDVTKVKVGAKWIRHGLDNKCDAIAVTEKGVVMSGKFDTDLIIAVAS